jgi:ABC-type phosphate/phosphonate transport system substrate-binding protein
MLSRILLCSLFLALFSGRSYALEFQLSIQPVLPKNEIIKVYQPLADYLSSKIGHTVKIRAYSNFLTYWTQMRKNNGFDLVLDAAHFTDYRAQKNHFDVLAKIPDTVSFSVVTHEDNLVFGPEELVAKKIATLVSPSVGALRMLDLFHDPMRQPQIVYAKDSNEAAQMVIDKKVDAAIIPSALVSRYQVLNTVVTTDSLPHMGFSASAGIPQSIKTSIQNALVSAKDSEEGRKMLSALNFPAFEKTTAKIYLGYNKLLKNVIGYESF